jgi:Mn2+/Fe2+ NRAMP family transporter
MAALFKHLGPGLLTGAADNDPASRLNRKLAPTRLQHALDGR